LNFRSRNPASNITYIIYLKLGAYKQAHNSIPVSFSACMDHWAPVLMICIE